MVVCLIFLAACDRRAEEVTLDARGGPSTGASEAADLVLTGGAIYTVDPDRSWAEALAARDGRITYVGDNDGVAAWIGPETEVVELEGRMVLPGIQDAHIHPVESGMEMVACNLYGADTVEEYVEIVRGCASENQDDPWIIGYGWSMPAFGPGALAAKELLDAVAPSRPVYLASRDGHSAWVSSRALELAGIDASTVDPADGRVDRDLITGEAIGSLQESAMDLVKSVMPPDTLEDQLAGLRYAIRMLNAYGITAVQEANAEPEYLGAYSILDELGELSLRIVVAQGWDEDRGLEQIKDLIRRREEFTHGRVDAGTVKIFQDGVMESYTAAMLEPYLAPGSPTGLPVFEPQYLNEIVAALDAEGFQVHFHAIGDAAIRQCLDAVEYARSVNGESGLRHHISHLELIDPADIPRFGALGVVANFQPVWAYPDRYITELTVPFIGPERSQWLYPIRSVLASGGTIAFGSDWSVSSANPFEQMEVAVRRSDPETTGGDVLLPEQAISLADAIAAFTINAAFVNHLELHAGSLEVGKFADLAVLDRNLFEVPAEELSETKVVLTLIEGKPVYGSLGDL